jgi:Kdo2-lipid IVA lauroyltransferase/acyltransferase
MFQKKLYILLLRFFSMLPFTFNGSIHKNCTYFLESILKYRKKTILSNLQNAFPHKSVAEINSIMHQNYKFITAYIFETIAIYAKKNVRPFITFNNIDVVKNELEKGKSVIILGSHFGNWEWSSMLLPENVNANVYAIYKPLENKLLDLLVKEWRSNFGLRLLAMNDVVKHMANSSASEIYIFVADQRPASINSGKWYTFLNQDTSFYEGASTLSKRYNSAVIYQKIICKDGFYKVDFSKIEGDVTSCYVNKLETDIIAHPDPWLWSHNRWKHKRTTMND